MHDPQPSFPPALPDLPDDQSWFIHYVGETSRAMHVRLDEEDCEDQLVGRLAAAIGIEQVRLVAATQAALNQACSRSSLKHPSPAILLLGERLADSRFFLKISSFADSAKLLAALAILYFIEGPLSRIAIASSSMLLIICRCQIVKQSKLFPRQETPGR